jgi:hypothetical protein
MCALVHTTAWAWDSQHTHSRRCQQLCFNPLFNMMQQHLLISMYSAVCVLPLTHSSGAQFGYHPGGWGKPPVDEEGNALYGDVFGLRANDVGFSSVCIESCLYMWLTGSPDGLLHLLACCPLIACCHFYSNSWTSCHSGIL